MSPRALRTEVFSSISQVPEPDWTRLAETTSLYLGHDCLGQMEGSPSAPAGYIVVARDQDVVGGVPFYAVAEETSTFHRLDFLNLAAQPTSYLCAGSRLGYHSGALLLDSLDSTTRRAALHLMAGELHAEAARRRFDGGWWLYVTDTQVQEICEAMHCDVPVYLDLEAQIELPGREWGDYLASLPGKQRQNVRREDSTFAAAGYLVRETGLAGCWSESVPLLANTLGRYGERDNIVSARDYLESLVRGATDPGSVLFCTAGDRPVGYSHYQDFGRTRWMRSVGFDYDRLRGAYEYFALTYYLPIKGAYTAGLTSLHLGIKSPEAKSLRGAALRPLWAVPFGHAADGLPADLRRERNQVARESARSTMGAAFAKVDLSVWSEYT